MANGRTFGRRPQPAGPAWRQAEPAAPVMATATVAASTVADDPIPELAPVPHAQFPSVDDELEEWKRARRHSFKIPWRQISLMAGLCFGIAALVLPASVSDAADWLLYGLMAASFFTAYRAKRAPTPSTASPAGAAVPPQP